MEEKIPCKDGHSFFGIVPKINTNVLEEQFPALVGLACECQKFLYNSKNCGCSVVERELDLIDNPNY